MNRLNEWLLRLLVRWTPKLTVEVVVYEGDCDNPTEVEVFATRDAAEVLRGKSVSTRTHFVKTYADALEQAVRESKETESIMRRNKLELLELQVKILERDLRRRVDAQSRFHRAVEALGRMP